MNRPPKSQNVSKVRLAARSPASRRWTRADLHELISLERAAKRGCFVPIPRAVSRLAKSNASPVIDRVVKFNEISPFTSGTASWQNKNGIVQPVSEAMLSETTAAAHSVMLVVDQRATMRFGSRSKTKAVIAAEIAAFISWRGLAQNARIGAVIFNDKKADLLWPTCSRLSVMMILHSVLNQNHALSRHGRSSFNSEMLNRALHRVEQFATNESTLFLITDASGYNGETHEILANIAQHSRCHLVLVSDPRQKKFSKMQWLLSGRFTRKLQRQISRDKSKVSSGSNNHSRIWAQGLHPLTIPITRFSTWENVTGELRRASQQSILPPQIRPPRARRRSVNGSESAGDHFKAPSAAEGAIRYGGSAAAITQRCTTQAL